MNKFLFSILFAICFSATVFAQNDIEIMGFKEYGTIKHERPYIINLSTNNGALLYFGIGHAYSYDDPQIAELEKQFDKFRPTLILNESGTPPAAESAKEAVEKYGEPGLLSYLAGKHKIPIRSIDPPRMVEIQHILDQKKWSLEQVAVFYILRRIPENNKKTAPEDPEKIVLTSLTQSAKIPGFESLPKTIAEFTSVVKRLLPEVSDWRKIDQRYFDPNPDLGFYTNEIANTSVLFRGKYMVEMLSNSVKNGERVFAVVGASHVVKQEKALKKLIGEN